MCKKAVLFSRFLIKQHTLVATKANSFLGIISDS